MSRIFPLRALPLLLAVLALGLSVPLLAQETALRGAVSHAPAKAGSRSTRERIPFIAMVRWDDDDQDGNRQLKGNGLVPGNRQATDVQIGVHPKPRPTRKAVTDLAGSNLFTQFKAFDGPNPYIPPDPSMATGPNDLLVATNDGWSIFDRSGNQLFTTNFSSWFGDKDTNDQYGDPHVIYDPWHSRFVFVVLMKNPVTLAADWVVDASDTDSANGNHHWYYLNARLDGGTDTNHWMDYPYIGYSANAVYLSGTMIDWSSGNWQYEKIRILNPSQLYSNGSSGVNWYDFWNVQNNGNLDFDIAPAQQLTNEGVEYLVNAQGGGGNYLTLRRITNELDWTNGPTLSAETVNVAAYTSPPAAGQPDGTTTLENSDCRLSQATMQFGRLNAVGPTGYDFGSGTRSALKIYRLLVDSGAPSTVDRDRVYGFSDLDAFYPAIQGTIDNDQFLTFDYSGTGTGDYASIAVAGWSNAESGVDQAVQTKGGEGDYFQDFGKGRNRWGDYSTVSLDPTDFRTVWSTGEYAATNSTATNGLWSTWVDEFNTKPNGVVAVNSAVGSIGQAITLSASLTNSQTSAAISGEDLDFYVDGGYVGSATTDGSGNGSVSYTVPSTSPGNHTITVNFPGDGTYNAGSGANTLAVYAYTDLAVPTVSGMPGKTVTLSATLTQDDTGADLSGQTVYFYVDGSYTGSAVTNGSGVASLAYAIPANTAGGSHTLEAYFPGAGFYNSADTFGTLRVTVNTVVTVGARTAPHGTTAALKSYLKTSGGVVLPGRTLTYKVNGVAAGSAVTDSTGLATLNYAIPASAVAGNEPIVVSFAGDSNDNLSSGTGTLTVTAPVLSTSVTVPAVSGTQGQTVTLSATLQAGSALLSGKTLTFKVDTTVVGTATTNSSGVAAHTFAIPASETAGGHTIAVSFAGDSGDGASSGTGTLTVTAPKTNTAVTVGNRTAPHGTTAALKSYLKTAGGVVLPGRTLTYKVNGAAAGSATTDSTGLATLNYAIPASAPAGNEPIVVSFAGDGTDNPSSGTGTLIVTTPALSTAITVPAVTGAQSQTVTLSATLKAGSTLLGGKTLTFKVDTTVVGTATTNSSGVAAHTFAIPASETAGGHTIAVSFAGDSGDGASSGTGTLTVTAPKTNTAVTVGNRTAPHGTTAALKSYLKTAGGVVLPGRTLTYKVNGAAAGSATTDSTGLATLNYAIPASAPAGNEPIVVSFAGDGTDNPSSGTGTLTVTN